MSDLDWIEPAAGTPYARVPEWIIDRTDLSATAKALYLVLSRHVNRVEGYARPGQERLCALLGCGHDRLGAAIRELRGWRPGDPPDQTDGWSGPEILRVQRRGQGRTNLYRLRFSESGSVEIKNSAQPKSRTPESRNQESRQAEVQNRSDPGTNQTEKNHTEENQERSAARAGDPEPSPLFRAIQEREGDEVRKLLAAEEPDIAAEVWAYLKKEAPKWGGGSLISATKRAIAKACVEKRKREHEAKRTPSADPEVGARRMDEFAAAVAAGVPWSSARSAS